MSTITLPSGRIEHCSKPGNCKRHGGLPTVNPGQSVADAFEAAIQRTEPKRAKRSSKEIPGFPTPGSVRQTGLDPVALAAHAAEAEAVAAILTDDEENAVTAYRHTSYLEVNPYLRGGRAGLREAIIRDNGKASRLLEGEDFEKTVKFVQEKVNHIDSAIAKGPLQPAPRLLYKAYRVHSPRGGDTTTRQEIREYVNEHFPVGSIIEHDAYTSTSADSDYMISHCRRRPSQVIVHEILTDKGLATYEEGEGNVQAMEREVLLPRGMRFEVVNVTTAEYAYSGNQPKNLWLSFANIRSRRRFTVVQLREVTSNP